LDAPGLQVRCDVSAADLGFEAVVAVWGRVSSDEMMRLSHDPCGAAATAHRLLPEARSLLLLAGSVNLHVTAWLRSLDELPGFEARLASWLTSLEVEDRSVCFATPKRMGFRLVDGRRRVPTQFETVPASSTASSNFG
ncbi:MAG: hypothetical protein ABIR34_04355, partial [Marmoricola sp.]